jgi:CheY-like chemotaxis protein
MIEKAGLSGVAADSMVKLEHSVPLCLLVAEDDELIRTVTCRILENAGHYVLLAADGDEALRVFDQNRDMVRVAVLDVVMPKRSGKAVYAHIRQVAPLLPVIFTTGYSPAELESLLAEDPSVALLLKPYRSAELLSEIDRMVQLA